MTTKNRLPKDQVERRVFSEFAEICPLRIRLDTIQSRLPPEPDILCSTELGERIAFEIVRCDDAHGSQSLSRGSSLRRAFTKFLTNFSRREELLGHLAGRGIFPHYQEGITEKKMKESFPLLCEFLLASDVTKPILDPFDPIPCAKLQQIIHDVELGKPSPLEPTLDYFPASWAPSAEQAILEALLKKQNKGYQTENPIELLLWFGITPEIIQEETWQTLQSKVPAILRQSRIRRLWVFAWGKKKILWEYENTLG